MKLAQLSPGELAMIVNIHGGRGFKQKLALKGITENCIVRIISSHGRITLEVNRNTVSIGRGMAAKIRVRRI
ncbi:MAG: FeoA family protein [Candidatus Saliniplasma sp.]